MKSLCAVLLVFFLMIISGCFYSGIQGKVVDSATGKPLEGALVVAQWTKTKGRFLGLPSHDLSMITETLTDKEGIFAIRNTPNDPFVDPPEMIIYKEGYIPWRNDMIFPGGRDSLTKDHEWKNNLTYKLDTLTDKYKARQIFLFLDHSMMGKGRAEVPMFADLMIKIQ